MSASFLDSLVRLPSWEPGRTSLAAHVIARQATLASRDRRPARVGRPRVSRATVQPAQADLVRLDADGRAGEHSIGIGVRVRNLGPAVATGESRCGSAGGRAKG
jgi:hypothetical protein